MVAEAARVELVGGMSIAGLRSPIGRPARRLLAFLALSARPMRRESVATALWPGTPGGKATASLRTAIWSLGDDRDRLLAVSGEHLALADGVDVDVQQLASLAPHVNELRESEATSLASSYAGELLPGWYEDWVISAQQRWLDVRVRALEAIARRHLRAGRTAAAIEAASAAVAADPFRETSRRILVEAHLAEGNLGRAVLEHRRFVAFLREELDVDATPEFAALIAGRRGAQAG